MTDTTTSPDCDTGLAMPHKNRNIGQLGERFIKSRLEAGVSFDDAWNEWEVHHAELDFVMVQCPEIRFYDDRSVSTAEDRARLRKRAKEAFGNAITSEAVSRLAEIAVWIGVNIPSPRYRMDRDEIRSFLAMLAGAIEFLGNSDDALKLRSEESVESLTSEIEDFANEHGFWAVPPKELMTLWRDSFLKNLKEGLFQGGTQS